MAGIQTGRVGRQLYRSLLKEIRYQADGTAFAHPSEAPHPATEEDMIPFF